MDASTDNATVCIVMWALLSMFTSSSELNQPILVSSLFRGFDVFTMHRVFTAQRTVLLTADVKRDTLSLLNYAYTCTVIEIVTVCHSKHTVIAKSELSRSPCVGRRLFELEKGFLLFNIGI